MGCFKAAIDAYTDVALLKEEVRHVPGYPILSSSERLYLMTRMSRRRIDCCISISSVMSLQIPKLVTACNHSCGSPLELMEAMFDLLSFDILVCGPPHLRWDLNLCRYLATMARVFKNSTSP